MRTRTIERSPTPRSAGLASAAAVLTLIAGVAVAGRPAARPSLAEANGAPPAASVGHLAFVGSAGSEATVTRTRTDDGGELLRGETVLRFGARAGRRILEEAQLDARGRLTRAEVTVTADGDPAPLSRLTLDPGRGVVRFTQGAGTTSWSAPTDAPWTYAPEAVPGRPLPTPVSAWVAHRAAAAGRTVRPIEASAQRAAEVPVDQVALATELGTTVVVGGQGADADGSFVTEVRGDAYGIHLLRVGRRAEPSM